MPTIYTPLRAGNVRRRGDEVRNNDLNPVDLGEKGRIKIPGPWEKVNLIGHKILLSDLLTFEYRRPL